MKLNLKITFVFVVVGLIGAKLLLDKDINTSSTIAEDEKIESLDSSITSTPSSQLISDNQKISDQASSLLNENVKDSENNDSEDGVPEYLEEFKEISIVHKKSLVQQMLTLSQYGKRQVDSEDLITELEKQKLSPEVRVDKNPYTGNLNVVRTNKVLPGTRYFHAQFFEDEDGSEYIQHLSFEFKGSQQSFDAVEKTVLNIFKDSALVQNQKNDSFRSWKRDDGYVIWMKKMDESDIQDNPFNAYTKEDIGTIRVAIELDIHDHAPAFHAEQGPLEETP